MAAEDNVATVKRIYEAFGQGDVETILDQLADEIDWAAVAVSDGAPWYGQRTSRDEVATFFQQIGEALDVSEFTPLSYASNDDEVMARIHFRFSSKATGREGETDIFHYWQFSDGKVVTYRGTEDTAQTLSVLGS